MEKNSGFTLLELIITLTLVSIVTAIGIPSISVFIKNDRLVTQINTMVGHLALARSEAVTGHQNVVICASSGDLDSCSSVNNWADGWILFVDTDNNSDFTAGENMLRQQQALSGGVTFTSSIGSVVTYDQRGFAPDSAGTFSLCDDREEANMKSLSISATGRVSQGGSATCP